MRSRGEDVPDGASSSSMGFALRFGRFPESACTLRESQKAEGAARNQATSPTEPIRPRHERFSGGSNYHSTRGSTVVIAACTGLDAGHDTDLLATAPSSSKR